MTQSDPIRVHRLSSPLGDWELATRQPTEALRPYVMGDLTGSTERCRGMVRRLELPHPGIVCIVNFGDGYRVNDPRARDVATWLGSFVAGLYDSWVQVDARGLSHCLQVNLTPLGAWRLLGLPLRSLANRSVPLDALLGGEAALLAEQLAEAPDWARRFDLLERSLLSRLLRGRDVPALLAGAWQLVTATRGELAVDTMAATLGCSRRHLAALVHEQLGLPPKRLGRIVRFHRVVAALARPASATLSQVAHACGYFDHAHLDRDFRDFAGLSPTQYLALHHPTFGTVLPGD
jgi:AraC-like DNA-binding protein